jgi:N-acetylglucosaminyldiphosphoundecaprenol N-acetyl-beta-D-mannosaminyltransferase
MASAPTTISSHPKYSVLGVPLRALQIPDLIKQMQEWIENREQGRCLSFANVHMVMEAQHDKAFGSGLAAKYVLNVPDGMPLVWVGRSLGFDLKRRVSGPDLMYDFCAKTADKGYRHFFYGGAAGVPEEIAANMARDIGGINVVGAYSPPFRPLSAKEDEQIVEMINAAKPDILWIGLGCPKQEKWAFAHRERLNVPILASVGQAFDIHAERVKQAPDWMRDNGLEWLYRLANNPRRLWRRYLVYSSQFFLFLALERMKMRPTVKTSAL